MLVVFAFFAGGYALSYSAYTFLPARRDAATTQIFLFFVVVHTLWAYAVWRLGARLLDTPLRAEQNNDDSLFLSFSKFIPAFVLLPRLAIFAMQAWLSDDVYRYLWDGGVLANGVNPYEFTPDSPALAAFRNADGASVYAQMDYRSVPTIYPPLAQYCFAASVAASRFFGYADWFAGYWTWKAFVVSAEIAGLLLVWKTIARGENHARKRRRQKGFLAYCCLPLPVVEFAGQAHLDALLLPPLACLLFLISRLFTEDAPDYWEKRRLRARTLYAAAGALCGALGAIKILPFALLAPLLRSAPARDFRFALLAGAILALGVACAPLLYSPEILSVFLRSASEASQTLQFNGGVYYVLCYACAALGVPGYWRFMPALFAVSRLPATFIAGFWRRARSREELWRLAALALAVATLWSPKVHTWYLAPLLLANIVVGWKWLYALAAGSMFSYSYYAVSPAAEQYGVEMAVWAIAAAVAIAEHRATLGFALRRNKKAK